MAEVPQAVAEVVPGVLEGPQAVAEKPQGALVVPQAAVQPDQIVEAVGRRSYKRHRLDRTVNHSVGKT